MSREKDGIDMATYTCSDCGVILRRSEALIRSINFQQVAYCRDCWSTNHASPVPAPRAAYDDAPARESAY